MHIWLDVERIGWVRLHTVHEDVQLELNTPYARYDMGEYGSVTVEHSGSSILDTLTGQLIERVSALGRIPTATHQPPDFVDGFVLHLTDGRRPSAVAFVTCADELVVEFWPPAESGSRLTHLAVQS